MKTFIEKFVSSESVKKEVGEVANFKKWLENFDLQNVPQEALDELVELIGAAEERSKIALIDLMRLLF